MAAAADPNWWRKVLVIATLPFAALGVAGCDNTEPGGEEGVEQEAPAGGEEEEAEEVAEPEASQEEESATEGELPYEDGGEEEGQGAS
ncbi:hypothetical protein [Kocuria sabuli]|uniref:hypothetical protein n=1 Tax=Kocuria sabuli TaxID=3071448 RepID=UPI0034D40BFE